MTALSELVGHAITKWAQAFERSSLVIVADPACGGKFECLCDTLFVGPGALRISLAIEGEGSASTMGYDSGWIDGEQRSYILLSPVGDLHAEVLTFAHELGKKLSFVNLTGSLTIPFRACDGSGS